jgi:hypothetical protein
MPSLLPLMPVSDLQHSTAQHSTAQHSTAAALRLRKATRRLHVVGCGKLHYRKAACAKTAFEHNLDSISNHTGMTQSAVPLHRHTC